MPDPWIIAFPTQGDASESLTHQGTGIVLDRWEGIELEFARLYSVFMGDPDGSIVGDYGKPRIFADRVAGLRRAAQGYFTRKPHQPHEGEFSRLAFVAERFADRRNEVAHGFVLPVDRIDYFRERMELQEVSHRHYLLIPPLYSIRKHVDGLPAYAYSYPTMIELGKRLVVLWGEITDLRAALVAS